MPKKKKKKKRKKERNQREKHLNLEKNKHKNYIQLLPRNQANKKKMEFNSSEIDNKLVVARKGNSGGWAK